MKHTAAGAPDSSAAGAAPQQGGYECTKWVQPELGWHTEIPIGDPVSGMAWEHNGIDSGTYNLTYAWDVRPSVVAVNE